LKLVMDDWLTTTEATFLSINLGLQILDGADMAESGNQSETTNPLAYCVLRETRLLGLRSFFLLLRMRPQPKW
jgi:hypothetical protein